MKTHIYHICTVEEFRIWFDLQNEKSKVQIDDRLSKIQDEGYFGDCKSVCDKDDVWGIEMEKWKTYLLFLYS